MRGVTRKTELSTVDGTPEKRIFRSIISDYGLTTGLNELIDNALDLWIENDKKKQLRVDITLDSTRQIISVKDNAGGVAEDDLRLLIAPGATRNEPDHEVIGIFGVGGKRAAVALGELVEIRTRRRGSKSLQIDINNEWLSSDDWYLAAYEIPNITVGTTSVEISKLRQPFGDDDVEEIRTGLGETYDWFIREGCDIRLNNEPIKPKAFSRHWSYLKGYKPRHANFDIRPTGDDTLNVDVTAGLITDRDPHADNYGVYVYCNHRLIVKELRTRDVGYFVTSEAGVPHPDASLCRVIIRYQGPAELMPWNSSKSGINFSHPAFTQVRRPLINLVSYFTSLSRRLKHDWDKDVFPHKRGKMTEIEASDIQSNRKIVLPKLPRTRKAPHIETLKTRNKSVLSNKPWTLGLVEAMGLVDLVGRQKLETKNRAALILLDSNFEIALKEFMVSRTDLFKPYVYDDAKIAEIFKRRTNVIREVTAHVPLSQTLLGKVNHYYGLRNKLIHERTTAGISDKQIDDYRKIVEQVLSKLFSLRFPKS